MEAQRVNLYTLIDNVPTDVSGKWVKKEDLKPFAMKVADYVLTKVENQLDDPALSDDGNGRVQL